MTKLWLVFKAVVGDTDEFQGCFSTEQRAIDACISEKYWIGSCILDVKIPDETIEWTDAYYPLIK
jgi:hypothetical protein